MPRIRTITTISPYVSYGYIILFDRLEILYGPWLGFDLTGLTASWVPTAVVTFALLSAAAWAIAIWRRGHAQHMLDQGSAGIAFLFGSGIYCGSFLLLGTNYTYRLMFLLLCLPQLFDWTERARKDDVSSRRLAYLVLGSCLISMWLKFHPEKTLHINQITDWVLFITLAMLNVLNTLHAFGNYAGRSGERELDLPSVSSPDLRRIGAGAANSMNPARKEPAAISPSHATNSTQRSPLPQAADWHPRARCVAGARNAYRAECAVGLSRVAAALFAWLSRCRPVLRALGGSLSLMCTLQVWRLRAARPCKSFCGIASSDCTRSMSRF